VKVQILSVPDCPNVAPLRQRLAAVLDGREGVELRVEVVNSVEDAARLGMHGSPTLLIEGVDPFAVPGQPTSVSCRLYCDETGRPTGAPSLDQLRQVLTGNTTSGGATVTEDCCGPGESAEALATWRSRSTPADPVGRAVHQAILRAFAATGTPPAADRLAEIAATHGVEVTDVVARLHADDVIRLDADGGIRVAYPFSAVPTRHRVRLASGVQVYAMCAIDALGMPAMLATDAAITMLDPVTADPITITVHNGRYVWDPATAVTFISAAAGSGPSADCCCDDMNAFTTRETAQTWMDTHRHIPGELLDPATAEARGTHIFGALLDPSR
jgi:hypothetical protein